MRICLVHVISHETVPGRLDWEQQVLNSALKAKRPDTELEVKFPKPSIRRTEDVTGQYYYLLDKVQITEKIIEAYKEGFDAVVVLCFFDPAILEASEIIDIPVVGEGESSMHLACMLGGKFGVITAPGLTERKFARIVENLIWANGLQDRAISNPVECPVLPDGVSYDQLHMIGMDKGKGFASILVEAARKCANRGADVVIIGSTGMSAAITDAGIAKLDELEIPIIDCIAAAVKMAEVRVDLKKNLGVPSISRGGLYLRPTEKDLNRVRRLFGLPEV